MFDQASKIELLEIHGVCRSFRLFRGAVAKERRILEVDLIIKPGKLSVLLGPGRASRCCALLVALLHVSRGRQCRDNQGSA
jgi:hypothetical protein